jgi:hypothetical protein
LLSASRQLQVTIVAGRSAAPLSVEPEAVIVIDP